MLLQVLKPVFHFINHREKLEIKIWATKSTKRPCTARRTMSVQKLMYAIFFSTQGPPIQIAVAKGRCVTGKWASSRENLSSGFPTKRVSNQSPQLQRLARKMKFRL